VTPSLKLLILTQSKKKFMLPNSNNKNGKVMQCENWIIVKETSTIKVFVTVAVAPQFKSTKRNFATLRTKKENDYGLAEASASWTVAELQLANHYLETLWYCLTAQMGGRKWYHSIRLDKLFIANKFCDKPVPSWDVTYQTLSGRE